jgi:hypothetical protein
MYVKPRAMHFNHLVNIVLAILSVNAASQPQFNVPVNLDLDKEGKQEILLPVNASFTLAVQQGSLLLLVVVQSCCSTIPELSKNSNQNTS